MTEVERRAQRERAARRTIVRPRCEAAPSGGPARFVRIALWWSGASALLLGCAAPVGLRTVGAEGPTPEPTPRFALLRLGGQDFETEWHLPAGPGGASAERSAGTVAEASAAPAAWLLLQHGFARRCANLRHLAATLAREAGVATLCLNAEMAGGNPALAAALAQWLVSDAARSPDGRAAPARLIVGGHSAGGAFAAQVGAQLAAMGSATPGSATSGSGQASDRLAGALLFDPVGANAMGRALTAVSDQGRRPVLALMAPASRCNAGQLGAGALRAVQASVQAASQLQAPSASESASLSPDAAASATEGMTAGMTATTTAITAADTTSGSSAGTVASASADSAQAHAQATAAGSDFVGVVFAAGTHVDAEGPDTEAVAVLACREGWPQPPVVQALQSLAAAWARDMAQVPATGAPSEASPGARARAQARHLLRDHVAWRAID